MIYSEAIRLAMYDSLKIDPKLIVLGQGVWSPFYVGSTMDNMNNVFGTERIMDTPVSENLVTGVGIGAALTGTPAVVIHPRMDFMLLAVDQIVNVAAKWRYTLNQKINMPITIRAIINRGGEQGAQHSQALHSWFAHIPGLRVVMPSTAKDAYFLLRQSILSPDPVLFIEDRWCYEVNEDFDPTTEIGPLELERPKKIISGSDLTIVSIGYSTINCLKAISELDSNLKNKVELIDLRVLNPLNLDEIYNSIEKTGKLLVVDEGWPSCGLAAEIICSVVEKKFDALVKTPSRITSINSPAPTSSILEEVYYIKSDYIKEEIKNILRK